MTYKNLILICGDEEYLRDQKKREILKALGGAGGFNYHAFDSDNLDLTELRSLIETPPFMEPYRRILLTHTGIFSRAHANANAAGTELTAIFGDIPETSYLIFDEDDVDGRGKLYKLVQKNGEIHRFESVSASRGNARFDAESRVRAFAMETLSAHGLRIDRRTLDELLALTGFDMRNLSTELEKLISYKISSTAGESITGADIDMIISRTLTDRIFYMVDEKLLGHTEAALRALTELFALKTQPMRIIYLLARQYDQAYFVKDCLLRRMNDSEIEKATGLKNWQLKRIKNQVRNTGTEELRRKLSDILDMEERVKTGCIDGRLAAELLIIA